MEAAADLVTLSHFYMEMPIKPGDERDRQREIETQRERVNHALVLTLIANDTNGSPMFFSAYSFITDNWKSSLRQY